MSLAMPSYAAHPYGPAAAAATAPAHARRASAAARRASLPPAPREPLPPVPTLPSAHQHHAAPPAPTYGYGYDASRAAPLPAYTRHDPRPNGAARVAKADRTREWVSTRRAEETAPAPSGSLAALGYAFDFGAAPPHYDDDDARPARRAAENETAIGLSLSRSLATENKPTSRRPKTDKPAPAAKAAKSVLRMFGRSEPSVEPGYAPLGDGERSVNTRR